MSKRDSPWDHLSNDPMPNIRVTRLSGGFLDVAVAESEVTQLFTIKDLKNRLAAADESNPPASLIQLFEPGKEKPLPPDAAVPRRSVIDPETDAPLLQYVITDDMMLILDAEARSAPTLRALDGDWPETGDGREQPWKMFSPKVAEIFWKVGYDVACGFDGCKEFIDAWKWLALGLSEFRINEVYPDGTTLLYRICRCTIDWGQRLQAFEFDTLLLEFIQLERLRSETISRALRLLGEEQGRLWWLPHGAEIALALIKKDAGREFWAGKWWPGSDNLLQHILDPLFCWIRRTNINGELCIALAEKLSLREFCNLNDHGLYVLNYTIGLVEQAAKMGEEELWLEVREAITDNMIRRFKEHPGPVKDLAELTDKLWMKNLTVRNPQAEEVLDEFERNLLRRVGKHLVDKRGITNIAETCSSAAFKKEITDILGEVCEMHRYNQAADAAEFQS